jgi:dTDP-glucose 4,6-dehydratase
MNILVTGGAGFIGSHFVLQHREWHPDDTVVVFDAMTYAANRDFLAPVISRIRLIEGDITDTALVAETIKRYAIDAIVNFAAETHVDRSITNAIPFIHTNILGIQSLIEVLKANPEVQLLHVSTDEVYGDLTDTDAPRTSESLLKPSSPYSATKASGDLLLHAARRTYGIKVKISRCTNNFGPHQANEKFIPTVIRSVLADKPIPLYGKGENKRDWLYVADHCAALETILRKGEDGKIYNVSADDERRNIDVAKAILQILDKPESLISFVTDRPGHDWRYALDSSDTRALGWKPAVGFDEGIKKTVEWYKTRGLGGLEG